MKTNILYQSLVVALGLICITGSHAMTTTQTQSKYSFTSPEKKATWESIDIEITIRNDNGNQIGHSTVSLRRKEKALTLQNLYIAPDCRGKHAGSALFKHTISEIQRLFPQHELITWEIAPTTIFKTEKEYKEAQAKLIKFYSKNDALIEYNHNDTDPTGSFVLKK